MSPNGKDYFKIPLPYGYNIFNNMGTMMAEVASGDREAGDAFGFMISSMIGSFAPVSFSQSKGLAKSGLKAATPTVLKPFAEITMNENHYGGTIYKENFPVGTPVPESELGRRTTPEAFKMVSRLLNEAFGGSEYVSSGDFTDINPDKIYHIFNFAIGGTGKFISNIAETGKVLVDKSKGIPTELEYRKIPFARKVMGEPNRYSDVADYYDRRTEIGQLYEELKAGYGEYKKGELNEDNHKFKIYYNNLSKRDKDKYNGVVELKAHSDAYDKAFTKYRRITKAYRKIEDPIERSQKINKIEDKVDSLIDKWNKLYEESFKTKKEPTN